MATIKFRLSAKADKTTGRSEVLVRFFHGKMDQYAKTNIFVPVEHWNTEAQRLTIPRVRIMSQDAQQLQTELTEANAKLSALRDYINEAFIRDGAGKYSLSASWLTNTINEHNFPNGKDSRGLLDVLRKYIEVRNLSLTREEHFDVLLRAFNRFAIVENIGADVELDAVTPDTIRAFEQYLINEHSYYSVETDQDGNKKINYLYPRFKEAIEAVPESRMPKPRGRNALNNFLNRFRTFFIWAVDNDYTSNNPFRKYEIPASKYGTPYYISIEERNHLLNFDFSSNPRLETQRDIFVFQCVIGCRVSDLHSLKKSSIINGAVEYIPQKTKSGNPLVVRVPLNAIARQILDKYANTPGQRLLPCISDQKYNDAIKEIFSAAGLTRPVTILNPTTGNEEKRPLNEVASSHLARRCFIGNLYKQVKDPNLIGKLSGHKEGSKAFARYRDIDEDMRVELVTMLE